MGDPITQVAPILDAAPPGTLVVSRETYELLKGTFECKPLTEVAAGKKGKGDGEGRGKNDAEEEMEVIGMQVLCRSDTFPEHLAQHIDAGFVDIYEARQKKAKKKQLDRVRRSRLAVDQQHDSFPFDSFELSPTCCNNDVTTSLLGHGGGSGNLSDTLESTQSTKSSGDTSPFSENRGNRSSGGRAYRKRVEDVFKTARSSVMSRHISILDRANGALANQSNADKTQSAISAAHYDAVLSFIPPPSRVALTESISELRRVTVVFITANLPEEPVNEVRQGRKGSRNSTNSSHQTFGGGSLSTGSSLRLRQLQHVACTLQREVVRHDGFVKELTVDDKGLVMVVGFGVPPCCRWAQDPALSACEAALAIKTALKPYGQRCGIGITTGEVFCGTIGNSKRAEYSMIGSVVNLSARWGRSLLQNILLFLKRIIFCATTARLMSAASKLRKGIFVDRATRKVAVRDGLMECNFYDNLPVKGKVEEVPVWQLKSAGLKHISRLSFDAEESMRDSMMNTLTRALNKEDRDTEITNPASSTRHRSYLHDTYDSGDKGDGMRPKEDDTAELVGREQEMSVIKEVMASAAEADGILNAKTENKGKEGERDHSKGDGSSRSVLSTLFGSCLGGSGRGSGRGGDDDNDGGRSGKSGKSGKLVLIEGEEGIGKTCLLKEVERSAGDGSGFCCFRPVFSTRQEANYGWWYILRLMQLALGDEQNTLLTHSQRSQLTLLLEVGDMMREMEKDMGSMGEKGIEIQRELTHALLMLMDVMTSAGVPGIMLILDNAEKLDAFGMDTVRCLLQPPQGSYPYTTAPFFPAVPNLVVVMALRPLPHASPTFKTHYAGLRDLADERIVLSGLSRKQLGNQLLQSEELRLKGVRKINHKALCFLHERSSGNFKHAMAWMTKLLENVGMDPRRHSLCSQDSSDFSRGPDHDEDQVKSESRPSCLRVLRGGARAAEAISGKRGSLDGFSLERIVSGRVFSSSAVDDSDHNDVGDGEGELALVNARQAMQAYVDIPNDVRAMYTAMNDSLSPSEILTLRVCSVLGEITPETLVYAQPGGLADFLQAGGDAASEGLPFGGETVNEENDLNGEVPDLKKTLKALVERGFLVPRTRGRVQTHGNERVPRVVTRDSLDGTTAVLSHHVSNMGDTHPMLDGKGIETFLFASAEQGDDSDIDGDASRDGDEDKFDGDGEGNKEEGGGTELLTFASFVHQEVTYQGWGLEHRRKVHERMGDVATEIINDLNARSAECQAMTNEVIANPSGIDLTPTETESKTKTETATDTATAVNDETTPLPLLKKSSSYSWKVARQKMIRRQVFRSGSSKKTLQLMMEKIRILLAATHVWRIHHLMMSGDFYAAKSAWVAAHEDLGGVDALHSLCRQKVLNVFSNIPGHFEERPKSLKDEANWADLHVVLLPWLRGVAQMFQLDARRRWALVRALVRGGGPWLRLLHQLQRERLAAVERKWATGMA